MCKITFTTERDTRNTVRFTEVLDGKLTNPVVGTIYVPKETLKAIGWKEGDDITIDLQNAGKPAKKGHKTAAEKAKAAPAKKATKGGTKTATKAATATGKKTAKKAASKK